MMPYQPQVGFSRKDFRRQSLPDLAQAGCSVPLSDTAFYDSADLSSASAWHFNEANAGLKKNYTPLQIYCKECQLIVVGIAFDFVFCQRILYEHKVTNAIAPTAITFFLFQPPQLSFQPLLFLHVLKYFRTLILQEEGF